MEHEPQTTKPDTRNILNRDIVIAWLEERIELHGTSAANAKKIAGNEMLGDTAAVYLAKAATQYTKQQAMIDFRIELLGGTFVDAEIGRIMTAALALAEAAREFNREQVEPDGPLASALAAFDHEIAEAAPAKGGK